MNEHCPCCGNGDTYQVQVVWETNRVTEVRICRNCDAQYEVRYGNPIKEATSKPLMTEPRRDVTVRSVSSGAELEATSDRDGIVRTEEGEPISAGMFEIVE